MSTAAVNPGRSADVRLKPFLTISGICHGVLILLIAISGYLNFRGSEWAASGGGSAVEVKLVGNTGLPMPKEPSLNDSQIVDPSKSLWKSDVQPQPPKPQQQKEIVPPDLKNVPDFQTLDKYNKKPPPPPRHKDVLGPKVDNPANAVPGPRTGAANIPVGPSTVPGTSPTVGTALQTQAGGDFGARYPWYVAAMTRRISQNWQQNTIDPAVRAARQAKTTVTFRIFKDGTVRNLKIVQPSGNTSMDNSAWRAMLSASNMPPLPNDYSGSYVDVTFDFDLSLAR